MLVLGPSGQLALVNSAATQPPYYWPCCQSLLGARGRSACISVSLSVAAWAVWLLAHAWLVSRSSSRTSERSVCRDFIENTSPLHALPFSKETPSPPSPSNTLQLAKKASGALGTTKFKSRSFEAWQKAGAVHLFPSDPRTTPYEERPYMQRKDGAWDGSDLKKYKMTGKGQGTAAVRLKIDTLYETAKKAGKLDSVSILGGAPLPWTNKAVSEMNNKTELKTVQGPRGVAKKKLSQDEMDELKAKLFKPIVTKKKEPVVADAAPPKKFFGLF